MNDVTLTDQYDFLQFNLSSLAVTISAPQLHYNALATFAFSVLLGDMSNDQGKYPIVVSFKPHRRNPVGQIRNGDRDHTTDFIGCQYIQIQGEYNAHPEVSDDVSDSIYLSIGIDSPRIIFYGEVYFHIFNLIDNLLGTSQYVITEEEYAAMNNNNRMSFYLKYLDDFRKHKVNIVGAVILFFTQLTSFTTITLTEVRVELPGELFIPSALQFTPSHHGDLSNPMVRESSKDNSILCSLSSCNLEFATNPSVMDMNLSTTPINIVIPCVENTSLSSPNQNLLTLDPIHIHLKQL